MALQDGKDLSPTLAQALNEVGQSANTAIEVVLTDGRVLFGRVESLSGDALVFRCHRRGMLLRRTVIRVSPSAVVEVAQLSGPSRAARMAIVASLAAAFSLPYGVSMKGDMVIPAAILGAVAARVFLGTPVRRRIWTAASAGWRE